MYNLATTAYTKFSLDAPAVVQPPNISCEEADSLTVGKQPRVLGGRESPFVPGWKARFYKFRGTTFDFRVVPEGPVQVDVLFDCNDVSSLVRTSRYDGFGVAKFAEVALLNSTTLADYWMVLSTPEGARYTIQSL